MSKINNRITVIAIPLFQREKQSFQFKQTDCLVAPPTNDEFDNKIEII